MSKRMFKKYKNEKKKSENMKKLNKFKAIEN